MDKQTKHTKSDYFEVAEGVWGIKTVFVNAYLVALNKNEWVLVDTGLKGYASAITETANTLFHNRPPVAILLTHGHFDHTGNIKELLDQWDVPVFAHELEIPYLNGTSAYPPPDPTVGGGIMSLMSVIYPRKPINLGNALRILRNDGLIPAMPGWEYVHTPGHAPGHVSLYRQKDKILLAGDAFVTTKQESAFSVALQTEVLSGPPKYFTYNWAAAKQSVKKLHALHPTIAATGHGRPMQGEALHSGLKQLLDNFEKAAVPSHGRYVNKPAKTGKKGLLYIPPKPLNKPMIAAVCALTGILTFALIRNCGFK